jgi:hypothetical protein
MSDDVSLTLPTADVDLARLPDALEAAARALFGDGAALRYHALVEQEGGRRLDVDAPSPADLVGLDVDVRGARATIAVVGADGRRATVIVDGEVTFAVEGGPKHVADGAARAFRAAIGPDGEERG